MSYQKTDTISIVSIRDIPRHFYIPDNFINGQVLERASGMSSTDASFSRPSIRLHSQDMEALEKIQFEMNDLIYKTHYGMKQCPKPSMIVIHDTYPKPASPSRVDSGYESSSLNSISQTKIMIKPTLCDCFPSLSSFPLLKYWK